MDGFSRQGATLTLVVVAMLLMPIGQPLPCAPDADTMKAASAASPGAAATRMGAFVEDDVEVEHTEFTLPIGGHAREVSRDTTGWFSSFLWTERLHRPPIA
ncbi:MAG: hypothetical protein Q8N23_00880 [Archangium sp.]|nr:hypothetical protein [Archangium sp.]MDP3151189.1 hypothetical protein [Archangium sp.]MDP3570170.1 hypothetical protein [Archangium sp.]